MRGNVKAKQAQWRRTVGNSGAADAALAQTVTTAGRLGSGTLPELLMEAGLIKRGLDYRVQAELGVTRVDHLVRSADGAGWVAIWTDGDYWHKNSGGHDYGKVQQVIGYVVEGLPIVAGVRVLESDLYTQADWVIDRAVAGEQVRMLS